MTFLSKLGSALAQGLAIATGIWPLVQGFFGQKQAQATVVVNDLTSIGQIILQAEAFFQGPGTGAQKLQKATPLVANIVKTSEMVGGHKIQNESLFIQGCGKIASGTADVLNSLDANAVQTASKVIVPSAIAKTAPVSTAS